MRCMYEGESIGLPAQGRPAGRDLGGVSLVQTSLLPANHGHEIVAPVYPTNIRMYPLGCSAFILHYRVHGFMHGGRTEQKVEFGAEATTVL